MAQVLPAWMNKPAREASEAEKKAFVELCKADSNLPVKTAALERDPEWAVVKGDYVRFVFVVMIDVDSLLYFVGLDGPAPSLGQE